MGRLAPQFGHALERVLDLNLCRSAIQELTESRLCSPWPEPRYPHGWAKSGEERV